MSNFILRVDNLRKDFDNVAVLKNISLDVRRGEVIVIIGGSGTGKSTFLRTLNLLERPTAGKIFLGDEDISTQPPELLRQRVGMIFQSFNLFAGLTLLENAIAAPVALKNLSRQDACVKAKKLFETVGLDEKLFSYPDELSGGQQQRAAIVRALMMEPEILLFDEPTSALDPTMVGEVLAVIRMLTKKNLTMLIVTHEMNFAREVATRVLFFADGTICEQGTPTEIFDTPRQPKTVAFIRRQKHFRYEISGRNFDLPAMQGRVQNFAERYGLSWKFVLRLQLCCEEITVEMLENCYADGDEISAAVNIVYVEATKVVELSFDCGGRAYNPFESADSLSTKILRGCAKNFRHDFADGRNKVNMEVVAPQNL